LLNKSFSSWTTLVLCLNSANIKQSISWNFSQNSFCSFFCSFSPECCATWIYSREYLWREDFSSMERASANVWCDYFVWGT